MKKFAQYVYCDFTGFSRSYIASDVGLPAMPVSHYAYCIGFREMANGRILAGLSYFYMA